jgi:hypothetical protein
MFYREINELVEEKYIEFIRTTKIILSGNPAFYRCVRYLQDYPRPTGTVVAKYQDFQSNSVNIKNPPNGIAINYSLDMQIYKMVCHSDTTGLTSKEIQRSFNIGSLKPFAGPFARLTHAEIRKNKKKAIKYTCESPLIGQLESIGRVRRYRYFGRHLIDTDFTKPVIPDDHTVEFNLNQDIIASSSCCITDSLMAGSSIPSEFNISPPDSPSDMQQVLYQPDLFLNSPEKSIEGSDIKMETFKQAYLVNSITAKTIPSEFNISPPVSPSNMHQVRNQPDLCLNSPEKSIEGSAVKRKTFKQAAPVTSITTNARRKIILQLLEEDDIILINPALSTRISERLNASGSGNSMASIIDRKTIKRDVEELEKHKKLVSHNLQVIRSSGTITMKCVIMKPTFSVDMPEVKTFLDNVVDEIRFMEDFIYFCIT